MMSDTTPSKGKPTELTCGEARSLFTYTPSTGELRFIKERFHPLRGPLRPEFDKGKGYLAVSVRGRMYQAHRVVWLMLFGAWPKGQIDHINGNRADNRIANLRDVPQSINAQNRIKPGRRSRSGALGVVWTKGKWEARITVEGKFKSLGRFTSVAEASDAYFSAKAQMHPGFVPARLQEQLA